MKWLILNTDYPEFLEGFYARHPDLKEQSYDEQLRVRNDSLFGVADFYSSNLRKLGHEAWDVHLNNEPLQRAWAREHGVRVEASSAVERCTQAAWRQARRWGGRVAGSVKTFAQTVSRPLTSHPRWVYKILAVQIRHERPDVLLNQDLLQIPAHWLQEVKPYVRLTVGQHAAWPLPETGVYGCYDLVVSSWPPTVEFFRRRGVRAQLHRLAFEPAVLEQMTPGEALRGQELTFIGSFTKIHRSRTALLEVLAREFPRMRVWGRDRGGLPHGGPLGAVYQGPAWGRDMYDILTRSRIVINHHGDIGPFANNLRLFEATGMGALLVTEWKENLPELFEPGREIVTYRTPQECVRYIRYYLDHEEERAAIARAGQERTLREHTYAKRMQELVGLIKGLDADKSPHVLQEAVA